MNVLALKIPPLVLTLGFGAAMWLLVPWLPIVDIPTVIRLTLVAVMVLTGVAFALAGVLAFRTHHTTVDPRFPEHASALVDSGIYRFSRNPMYVGFALWLLAWVVLWQSPWLIAAVIGFVLYMNRFQIEPEEQALTAQFGDTYRQYKGRVRRWL